MCGIAGVVRRGGPPDEASLRRMAAVLDHRGPDRREILVEGPVGLVHTRLAILGPGPAGDQPMRHRDGWWLSYNGEIFNHWELRSSLPPYPYQGNCDTETLLHALASWGVGALAQCNGIFALAAFDARGRRLLLARDRLGVKPFYIAHREDEIWFSSEIRALQAAGLQRAVRLDALSDALRHRWVQGRSTPLASIERLLPGTVLVIDVDDLSFQEVEWFHPSDLVDAALGDEFARIGRPGAARRVEDALRESVRGRLLADVPVGLLCSGGLDSSLVTALAAAEHPGLFAYHAAIPDQPDMDESAWARRVCDELRVELRSVDVTPGSWRTHFVRAVAHFEYPLVHESSVALSILGDQVRRDGIRVLLGGEGADEIFGGYGTRHLAERAAFAGGNAPPLAPAVDGLARILPCVPGSRPAHEYEEQVRRRALTAYAHHRSPRRELEAALLGDLSLFLPHGLNRLDKNLMQHSVEFREPFLDPNLLRIAVNLPLEMRLAPRIKGVLLDISRRHLPADVVDRPKVGFSFDPTSFFLSSSHADFLLRGRLREVLEVPKAIWGEEIQTLSLGPLFRLWSAEIWVRIFLDAQSEEEVEAATWK